MGYCLATQEARAVEDERLAKEEEERIRIEEENRRIEMEVATKARREARQARRDAGESDVEEDTVYGGNTNRSHLTTGRTGRTGKATGRTGGKKTNRTGGTTGRSGVATGRSGGRTGRTTGRSGGKTARQRAEALAETQRLLEEENERKLIIREKISSFLCGGEIVVMIIEGKDCVNGILELVGDDDVDYWPDFPDSLRSKYGTDSLRNAVESSIIPIAGHREAEYVKHFI
jgi:nucleoside diphosphate kinase